MSETPTAEIPTLESYLGAWGIEERGQTSLEFVLEDLRVSGSDGCNRIFGSWELNDDGSVELKHVASTMMFCQGVVTWMSGASTVKIIDGALVFTDADATVIGSLERRITDQVEAPLATQKRPN